MVGFGGVGCRAPKQIPGVLERLVVSYEAMAAKRMLTINAVGDGCRQIDGTEGEGFAVREDGRVAPEP